MRGDQNQDDDKEAVDDGSKDQESSDDGEERLAALVIQIACINTWNRIKVASREIGGERVEKLVQPSLQTA